MLLHYIWLSYLVFTNTVQLCGSAEKWYQAVVIAPVADASGASLLPLNLNKITEYYEESAHAPDKGCFSCLRIHQLKYNEVVIVKDENSASQEAECEVSNLYYLDGMRKKRSNFWLLKKHLMPLRLVRKKIEKGFIPDSIDLKRSPKEYNHDILTLVQPWFYEATGKWYCPGTRFVRAKNDDSKTMYVVYFIDYENLIVQKVFIPKKLAVVNYPDTPKKRRALFLGILKKWARETSGFIPYVYGGCSFTQRCADKEFLLIRERKNGKMVSFWQRKHVQKPLAGFDCSGMLLTAAQIAGMPYYLKNTLTLSRELPALKKGERLQEGDFIWYSGHVLVVSDVKKNLLIEASGYEAGYGKVHEIHVSKVFNGIKDLSELIKAYHSKKFLKRLNSDGKPYRSVYRLKVLLLNPQ